MTRVPTKRSTKSPKKLRVGDNKNSLKNNKTVAINKFANNNNC